MTGQSERRVGASWRSSVVMPWTFWAAQVTGRSVWRKEQKVSP